MKWGASITKGIKGVSKDARNLCKNPPFLSKDVSQQQEKMVSTSSHQLVSQRMAVSKTVDMIQEDICTFPYGSLWRRLMSANIIINFLHVLLNFLHIHQLRQWYSCSKEVNLSTTTMSPSLKFRQSYFSIMIGMSSNQAVDVEDPLFVFKFIYWLPLTFSYFSMLFLSVKSMQMPSCFFGDAIILHNF